MAVAAPPETPPVRKKRKSRALPVGLEQHRLETLFSLPDIQAQPTPLPVPAIEARSSYVAPPGQVSQLDFFALAEQEPDAGSWKSSLCNGGAASRAARGRRKTKKSTVLPEGTTQLTLDDLFASTSPFAWPEPEASQQPEEVYRPAPRRRTKEKKKTGLPEGMEQPTLFAASGEAATSATPTLEGELAYERPEPRQQAQPRRPEQPDFDALAEPLSETAGAIPEGEPPGNGAGEDSAAHHRPGVRADSGEEDELPGSQGDDSESVLSAGRRIVLDEPESELTPSRDFRITEAHGVGSGGLHEKARANIAAIRCLKTLEAENREATTEEKAVLVRYSGWGALAQVFEPEWKLRPEWKVPATELQQLLTEEEYRSAKATTPNAHFTSPLVITAIWKGLEKLGVKRDACVLEPSMGIGHFFGLMPESLQGCQRTGVELDSLTARIAKQLYPDSRIFHKGFEETALPDNYFDVAVGNVPFGDYGVHDPDEKLKKFTHPIHDYFFAKTLTKLRPGGIMALVTSRYTMDKKDDIIRKHLAQQADLIGAVRLPNTAFKGNAGTEVVTDILFLRKRAAGKEAAGEAWTESQTVKVEGREVFLNEYYIHHPERMLGELTLKGSMHRDKELTLSGELTPEKLEAAMRALPGGVLTPRAKGRSPPALPIADPEAFSGVKDGAYTQVDGKIVIRTGHSFTPTALSASASARVRGLMQVRDAVREVFRTQLDDAPDAAITRARAELNRAYDRFTRQYGCIHDKENLRVFTCDPDHPLLLSLEDYNAEKKSAAKTLIFTQRTLQRAKPLEHVESASEALAISLNETGAIDWQRMASLTGNSVKVMQAELEGQVYLNPEGDWETADEYLSGDVRRKLKVAEDAAGLHAQYRPNVLALKEVQPPDIQPGDINARLGASWIPRNDIRDFIAGLLQVSQDQVKVGHSGLIATWSVDLGQYAAQSVSNSTTWGTRRMDAASLVETALNMKTPTIQDTDADGKTTVNQTETIAAREMQQKLKDRFARWIWEDPERTERLARAYNDRFNNIRLRTYDGSHLTLPGMNRVGLRGNDLDPHQKNAVWRILQTRNALIGHCVGAGKTATCTAACMELKRLGLRSKPMIVVPNHLVEQWGAAFLQLYPHANIFVAGKEFFEEGKREKAMARIASGNYDAVILSHKSFEKLPVADRTFQRFVQQQLDALEDAILEAKADRGGNRSVVKDLEKAKKRLEAKIKNRAGREKKDDGVTFEELGIDQIIVDEADLFKNLSFTTKMGRLAGIPNSESNRALDMFMKTRYVSERGGGITFATGTPISNTMAEMYTLMRYLAPEQLEAAGVAHFDAWAANFGEAVTALELAPDGSGYRMNTRFAKFVNLPELLSQFRTFADIQTAQMLKLPRPKLEGGKPQVMVSPASPALKEYVSGLVRRAKLIRQGTVDPWIDNMLKITGDGRKAALDMRLVGQENGAGQDTKVRQAIDNIFRIWKTTAGKKSTQVVFCDMSTPAPGKFNVYDEIKTHLIARGIPEKEIAFIHDADTDARKKTLFDAVNAGRVRILLGSTEKMGAGTNVQKKLKAKHDLDCPWRPRDMEQRDGRILRQGNENESVEIYRYVTEGSFDAYMWQTLETKQRFISQIMSGDVTVREAEDLESSALNFAEIKAIASGNPAVMEKVRIDTEVRRLDMLRAAHINQQYEIGQEVRALPGRIERVKQSLAALRADIATRDAHGGEKFTMTIGDKEYTGKNAREEAGKALTQAITSALWEDSEKLMSRGHTKGFEIWSRPSRREGGMPELYLRGASAYYEVNFNPENPLGTIASIEHALRNLDRDAEKEQATCGRMEKALTDFREQLTRPFEHEEKLRELFVRQQDINKQLDLDKGDVQAAAANDNAPQEEEEKAQEGYVSRLEAGRGKVRARVAEPAA
ncbi:N-domain protein, SNF2 family [Ktedonosporobacter rubrisoli]|uniref:N-domain protein, SNF2 family n=1 Tax=Ktedonosporobacter rubrisoli TaxID=2509675 RepID=A0A4P6JJB1_KTERU|nr:DEAD/DEAH box helicase family protein [Ktedonosporobacter rubrisoli]QBD75179.1 N-domain protein, SNF2 family [Ktedonosporobacter rubrisoli]